MNNLANPTFLLPLLAIILALASLFPRVPGAVLLAVAVVLLALGMLLGP